VTHSFVTTLHSGLQPPIRWASAFPIAVYWSPLICYIVEVTLWIVPPAIDAVRLNRVMSLRPKPQSPHNEPSPESYPAFHPHITLASFPKDSGFTLSQIRDSIPHGQHVLNIGFSSVEVGQVFYRSVYITIQLTNQLADLHDRVHAALGAQPRTPSFPHISLCYISDADGDEERQRYRALVKTKEGPDNAVAIECGADEWVDSFTSPEIWIVDCDGPVSSWKVQEKIILQ
jgi:2',3'-cyclic-nucleotide 3'-phosphodiesterase